MVTGALILAVVAMLLAGLPEHSGVRGYVRNYAICYAVLIGLVIAGE